MKKWLIMLAGSILILQGCVTGGKGIPTEQKREENTLNLELLNAVELKDTNSVSRLITKGANINVKDENGRTATMLATYNNDVVTAKTLIKAGADVNIQDDMKNNPFLYAGAEGYLDILKLTIEACADPTITNRYGGTALIPASEHGYLDVIKELLTSTDIDVNHVNNLGWTALMEAIILNNGNQVQQETVQLLIDNGADVTIPDKNNVTPLQHARKKGFKEIEQILVDSGAM
ncbi:ankyrin repeat domain-containing protein [Sporosarcina sp. FSL K6-5500]|uniref:ankyrin repeat domain-containing protein n=1 Tax=Sporosarcina sp. FSL K6-5500 TaxID=2921558 RepID=UPI0030F8E99D